MSNRSPRRLAAAAATLVAAAAVLASSGCGPDEKVVCSGPREHYVLVPSISQTSVSK
jgi:hypothetical protein